MINDIRLFTTGNNERKSFWYWSNNPICSICKELIIDFNAFYIVDWDKKKGRINNLLHINCVPKFIKSPLSITQYRFNVLLTDSIPPASIPVFIQNPSLKPVNNNVTVFDVNKLDSEKEKDLAWRSKRYDSIEGATIGKGAVLESDLEERDPLLTLSELRKKLLK